MESISTSNSTPRREGSPMRLTEHLQEQQEPFKLEAYLMDRGYARKSMYSEGSVGCFSSGNSSKNKFFRRSARSFGLCRRKRKKSTNVANKCLEVRKALIKKLVSIGEVIRMKRHHIRDEEFHEDTVIQGRRNGKEAVPMEESERLSSVSSSTEFSSQMEIHVEDTSTSMDGSQIQMQPNHQINESATDSMIQWRIIDENKQCSPDSVLDEIEASPSTSAFSLSKKPTEENIFSASLWDLIIRREKQGVFGSNNNWSRYIRSKKALQQTRQLLFDCVREAVESQGRQRKTGHLMGPEKLGKIICDKMGVWDRQSVNGKKIPRLLRSDLTGSVQEWDSFEGLRGDVVKEVGDQILEQIKDEMVEEVIGFLYSQDPGILLF